MLRQETPAAQLLPAALLGFAVAVLAYNILAVLKRSVEQAHREQLPEGWEASPYHLAVQVRSRYEGMLIALPVEHWPAWADDSANTLAQRLLELARYQAQPGGHQQARPQGG